MSPPSQSSPENSRTCSTGHMILYATGEGATSLVMNGIFGFAMLFYTKALGLNPQWAGIAMSVSVFWEALSEPIMGHVSDKTRSRYGRRHPYMLVGGLLMATCSYLIWSVPPGIQGSQVAVFSYLLVMNLVLRTGLTMFFIPYLALGFEMCGDYQGRSRLQGLRWIMNMIANFSGPAMAWTLFFQDVGGRQATAEPSNYLRMGTVFALATAVFVLLVVVATFRWREDTRERPRPAGQGGVRAFARGVKEILLDPHSRWIFVFIFVVCVGMVLVSSLQMYVYDDFMRFDGREKSVAHGGSMVGFAIGAAVSAALSRRFDKKGAVMIGGGISIVGNALLAVLFLTGILPREAGWEGGVAQVPTSLVVFTVLHAGYWLGNGILLPIATAMMADVSEIHYWETGQRKDGGYSSVFSLAMRLAISFSMMVAGYCLSAVGYRVAQPGQTVTQSPDAIWRVGFLTFVVGALIAIAALAAIAFYPVNRRRFELLRAQARGRSGEVEPSLATSTPPPA